MTDALLRASAISVRRGDRLTLEPSDLSLRAGETVAIYGPNGAGKSTLVQALAGLLPIASGEIALGGSVLGRDLRPLAYHRRIAAVFQEPLLLRGTVAHNVALGLRLRQVERTVQIERTRTVLEQLKIGHLAERSVAMLSGGEAQRTSLARALALDPEVLFLDEPFAALDQPSRLRLMHELGELLRARRMATVFVTHDLTEATALCDRCIVMDGGEILQDGSIDEVLERPRTRRVAEIVGFENIWRVEVKSAGDDGPAIVDWHGHSLAAQAAQPVVNGPAWLVSRADDLQVASSFAESTQAIPGHIRRQRRLSHGSVVTVAVAGGGAIEVFCPPSQTILVGESANVALPEASLLILRD